MRAKLGAALQIAGLVAMPVVVVLGVEDRIGFGVELLLALVAVAAIYLGRGLRGGATRP